MASDLVTAANALTQRYAASAGPLSQRDIDPAIDLAIDANAAGRGDIAVALLTPLTARAPALAKLWQVLGLALRGEQRMGEALAAFDRAAALNPGDARIALGKAQVSFEAGLPAAAAFGALLARGGDANLTLTTADALMTEGRAGDASALIARVLADHPDWLDGQDAMVRFAAVMGEGEPTAHLAKSVAAHPGHVPLRLALVRNLAQLGDYARATQVLEDGRRRLGDQMVFDAVGAMIATEAGDDARAETLFNRAARFGDPGITRYHIRHCLRIGRADQAAALGEALLGSNAAPSIWPYLSLAWRLMGDERAAWLDGDPPFVRVVDLDLPPTELQALGDVLRGLHIARAHLPDQSVRGGTQTDKPLFHRLEPEIAALKARITDAVRDYIDALPPFVAGHPLLGTPRGEILYEGSWSVRLNAQGFHTCHTHLAGWISSAFYVSIPAAAQLGAEPSGWLELGAPPADLRVNLPAYARHAPVPGRLVLFPSTMWHGTLPFDDGERLTIAFDVRTPRLTSIPA